MPYDPNEIARPKNLVDRIGNAGRYVAAVPTVGLEAVAGLAGLVHGGLGMLAESTGKVTGLRKGETYGQMAERAREREAAPSKWVAENAPFGEEADEMLQNTIGYIFNKLNTKGDAKGEETFRAMQSLGFGQRSSAAMGALAETSYKAIPYLGLEAVGMRAIKGTKNAANAVKTMGDLVDAKAIQNSLAVPKPKAKSSPRYVEFDENAPASKFDVSPELQADRLGVKYDGAEEIAPGKVMHWYTDPVTKSTFMVGPGRSLKEVLTASRKKFEEPAPVDTTLSVEDQIRQVDEGISYQRDLTAVDTVDDLWNALQEQPIQKRINSLWDEYDAIGKRKSEDLQAGKYNPFKEDHPLDQRAAEIKAEIDSLRPQVFSSPEFNAWDAAYKNKALLERKQVVKDQVEFDNARRDKWDSSPRHGTDMTSLEDILENGVDAGSAMDVTKGFEWASEFPVQIIMPSARKGTKIEHNGYYKTADVSRAAKVIVDMTQYTVEASKKYKKQIVELAKKYPDTVFVIKNEKSSRTLNGPAKTKTTSSEASRKNTPSKIEDVLAEHAPDDTKNASYITQQGKPVGDITNGHAATLETIISKMGWGDELFHHEDLGRAEATKRTGMITRVAIENENIFATSSEHMTIEQAQKGVARYLRDAGVKDGILEFDGEQTVVKAEKGKPEAVVPPEAKGAAKAAEAPKQKKGWRKKPAPSDPLAGTKADARLGELMDKPTGFITNDQLGKAVESTLAKGDKDGFLKVAVTFAAQAATRNTVRLARKLAGDLNTELPTDIHYAYRELIDALKDGIDPTFRSEKNMNRLKKTEQFLRDNSEMLKDMPDRVVKLLSKKPVKDMTLRELHDIHTHIFNKDNGLIKLGQLRYKLEQAKMTRARETIVTDLTDALSGQKDTKSYLAEGSSSTPPSQLRKQTWKDRWISSKLSTLIPQQVFDILDGGKNFNGVFHSTLYKLANAAVSEEMKMARRSVDAGGNELTKLGLNWHHWNKRSKVAGADLSRQEMLQIYLGWKNPSHRAAIMENRGFTEPQAQAIIRDLSPQEKAFGDFILKDNAESAPRINRVLQRTSNKNLTYEPNYSTIVYDGDVFHNLSFEEKLSVEMEVRRLAKNAAPSSTFVQERLGNAPKGAKLNMNAVDNWLNHVAKREHYIANAEYIKHMGKIFSDSRVVDSIRQKHGQPAVEYVRNYLNDLANPSLFRDMSRWAQMSRILRRNTATAYIALNPTSILMQTASLPKYLRDAGTVQIMSSLAKFVSNAPAMYKKICEMEPQIKDRFFEREAAEMGELHKTQAGKALEDLQNAGMWPTKMMDKVMVIVGYDAVYNRYLPKLGEAGARAKALETTLRTQSATHVKDLAPLYKTNEAFNWALMFTNDLSKTWGEAIHTLPADIKAGRLREAGYTMAGMGTMAIIAWSIAHKAIPNSPADIADAFTEQSLSTVPMVGNLMMSKKAGYGDSSAPVMNALSLPGTLLSDASDKTKARQTGEAISVLLGLPFTATRKAAKAIKEEDPMKLLGEPRANTFETGDGIAVRRSSTRNSRPGRYSGRGGRRYLR